MSEVLFDTRWFKTLGIGRFARELFNRIPGAISLDSARDRFHLLDPLFLSYEIWRHKPNVYFSPGFNPPLWSTAPFVFTIFDLIHLKFPDATGLSKRIYYETVVRNGLHRASGVLTGSEFSRQEIVDWFDIPEDRIAVVGCGVDERFSPNGESYTPGYQYLLYVGDNERPHKNVRTLVTAFAQSGLPSEINLILTGNPYPALVEHITSLDLSARVHFAGFIDDDKLPSYYRGAKALVLPSYYEGFGLPIIEAMASGTPVLTSSATCIPEIAGNAAVYVDPGDSESIAAGISEIVNDSALRRKLREKGFERARTFTWDKTATKVRTVLEQAARG